MSNANFDYSSIKSSEAKLVTPSSRNVGHKEKTEVTSATDGIKNLVANVFTHTKFTDQKSQDNQKYIGDSIDVVSKWIKDLISDLAKDGLPEETLKLIEQLPSHSADEFKAGLKQLAVSHASLTNDLKLANRRLDSAIEVDFKAYLPEKAPILYKEWKILDENTDKNPLDCLEEIYGAYLKQGVLFQDDLGGKDGLDPALMKAITNYCGSRKIDYKEIIRPKKEKSSALIEKNGEEKMKRINTLRTIRERR